MITAIEIENFKAVGSPGVRVEIRPITLLFGPNSVGKSSIIQALQYFGDLLSHRDPDIDRTAVGGESVDLGGFHTLVHAKAGTRRVRLRCEFDCEGETFPTFGALQLTSQIDARLDDYLTNRAVDVREEGTELQDWPRLLKRAWVELHVAQRPDGRGAYVAEYRVGWGDEPFSRLSGVAGATPHILAINADHPLLRRSDLGGGIHEAPLETVVGMIEERGRRPDARNGPVDAAWLELPLLQSSSLPQWGQTIEPTFMAEVRERRTRHDRTGSPESEEPAHDIRELQDAITLLSACIATPGQILAAILDGLRYVGPLREVPPRGFSPVRSAQRSRWSGGLGAWDLVHLGPDLLVTEVSEWLSDPDRLDSGYRLERREVVELDYLSLRNLTARGDLLDRLADIEAAIQNARPRRVVNIVEVQTQLVVAPCEIGVGISQVLPVVVAALADGASLVVVEQPEIHIHPRVQVGLGDLFIEAATASIRPKTFILETHSEHLTLRILRRIRESTDGELPQGKSSPGIDRVAVNVLERDTEAGLRVHRIGLTEEGDFSERWPEGFFSERSEELF